MNVRLMFSEHRELKRSLAARGYQPRMTPDPVATGVPAPGGSSASWVESTNQPDFIGACSLSLSLVTGLNAGKRVPGVTLSGSPA